MTYYILEKRNTLTGDVKRAGGIHPTFFWPCRDQRHPVRCDVTSAMLPAAMMPRRMLAIGLGGTALKIRARLRRFEHHNTYL